MPWGGISSLFGLAGKRDCATNVRVLVEHLVVRLLYLDVLTVLLTDGKFYNAEKGLERDAILLQRTRVGGVSNLPLGRLWYVKCFVTKRLSSL